MGWNWRSRVLGTVGVGAMVMGAVLAVASPAGAEPVADADALRQTVSDLNGDGPEAQIELRPGVTYTLPGSGGCADDDDNRAGDLDIDRISPLRIFTPDGLAPAVIEMACDTPQRVIHVLGGPGAERPAGALILRNVVIRNGHAPAQGTGEPGESGGGVLAGGDVIVENARFEGNKAGDGDASATVSAFGGSGGGLFASGAVTIDGSTFAGNRAGNAGDGISVTECTGAAGVAGGAGGSGGAVFALGGLTITNSTFAGNHAGNGGDGANGTCGNSDAPDGGAGGAGGSGGSGGAVQCGSEAQGSVAGSFGCGQRMTVSGSTFTGNVTGDSGDGGDGGSGAAGGRGGNGAAGDSARSHGHGGAIHFIGSVSVDVTGETTLRVVNSTIDGNRTGNGGAGGDGGAGGAGRSGGDAGEGGRGGIGGAITATFTREGVSDRVALLVHVTATDNGAGGAGGAPGQPGAVADDDDPTTAPGRSAEPGTPFGGSVAFGAPWQSAATVIGTSASAADGPDCWTPADSTLSRSTDPDTDETGCGFGPGSVAPLADYALAPLADNGGPTQTRLPASTSTLVDKITEDIDIEPRPDQRGVPRPQGAGGDIGAAELQLIDPTVTKTASAASVTAGTPVIFTIAVTNNGSSSPRPGVSVDDPKCANVSAPTGDANANDTLDPGETFTYTCTATPTEVGTFTNTVTATVTDGAGVVLTRTASVDVAVTAAAGGGGNTGGDQGGTGDPVADRGSLGPLPTTGANPYLPLLLGGILIAAGLTALLLARLRRLRRPTATISPSSQ